MNRKIKVLVVDDSAIVRDTLTRILNQDPDIDVTANASDPYEAVKKIAENLPDVITLDIEMPRMDGLTFIAKLMKQHPIPVVVISSIAGEGSEKGIRALKLGASEIITKPKLSTTEQMEEYSIWITDAVKAAAMTESVRLKTLKETLSDSVHSVNKEIYATVSNKHSNKFILIGASTGGTEVISKILKNLRTDLPGILIVQHMPGEFTGAFAKRLNQESKLNVKEAEQGDIVQQGSVYTSHGHILRFRKHLEF